MQSTPWLFAGRFKRIATGMCAVVILSAVPAAALTWTDTWTPGFGAQGVIITASNNTAGAVGPTTLTIDFGTAGSGKFKASRSFTLGAGENRLRIAKQLNASFFDGGDIGVKVKVKKGKITVSGNIDGTREAASPSTVTVSGAA